MGYYRASASRAELVKVYALGAMFGLGPVALTAAANTPCSRCKARGTGRRERDPWMNFVSTPGCNETSQVDGMRVILLLTL